MVNWVDQMAEQKSKNKIWFNRMVEHWTLPGPDERDRFLDHVRLARIQVVQSGNFGPFFYGLGDDPEAERYWVGMPLVGVRENLDYAAELIQDIQDHDIAEAETHCWDCFSSVGGKKRVVAAATAD